MKFRAMVLIGALLVAGIGIVGVTGCGVACDGNITKVESAGPGTTRLRIHRSAGGQSSDFCHVTKPTVEITGCPVRDTQNACRDSRR